MWTAKWILDEYEAGNEAVRLDMFLVYSDLRSYFEEIDARNEKADEQRSEGMTEKPDGAWWSHCCRLVKG